MHEIIHDWRIFKCTPKAFSEELGILILSIIISSSQAQLYIIPNMNVIIL